MQLRKSGDMDGFQEMVFSLVPRIEKLTGTKVTREVPAEIIKTYTEVGGAPHLDGEYTVFGKVIKGLQVIDKIASLPGDESDRPLEDVSMVVSVEELPKSKITKLYGYQYPAK
jgi:peptidyl-prolyl cis-trans isomerase B (cyclophilin B)